MLRFGSLVRFGVPHGITARTPALPANGDFSFMSCLDPATVLRNRAEWCASLGVSFDRLVCARQAHGDQVAVVDDSHAGCGSTSVESALYGFDALATRTPDLPLAVLSADCATVLFYDPVSETIAATHAGWRGTVAGVAGQTVETLRSEFGVDPANTVACVGPAICVECYDVGEEVIDAWRASMYDRDHSAVRRSNGAWQFDITRANVGTLLAHGVREEHIELSGECTRCANGRYFSRRGIGPKTGLMASIIALPGARQQEQDRRV
jgi:polyphenol oxidase